MDDYYRINVCRGNLVDSEIPLLERVIAKYFGITGEGFNRAFGDTETVSFENEISVDLVQECVFTLEEQGFKVSAEKVDRPIPSKSERVFSDVLDSPNAAESLTYEDCHVLFSKKPTIVSRMAKYNRWVAFGCTAVVLSVYFIMVYSAVA